CFNCLNNVGLGNHVTHLTLLCSAPFRYVFSVICMPNPISDYLDQCRRLTAAVAAQEKAVQTAADWFTTTILAGRMVHVFGSGHSVIRVEEMGPRYGSFPGFTPIVKLSLPFHNPVVGANGQRQAMFLENVSGRAERIPRNLKIDPADSALVISSGGC